MIAKNYGIDKFPKNEKRRVEGIELSQQRYEELRAQLAKLGTEVSVQRVRENDQDESPGSFVKRAQHVFVFPPQADAELIKSESVLGDAQVVDDTPGYELWWERSVLQHREEDVKGRLRLEYDDGGDSVHFTVEDGLEDGSKLPDEVIAALDAIPHVDIVPPEPKPEEGQ